MSKFSVFGSFYVIAVLAACSGEYSGADGEAAPVQVPENPVRTGDWSVTDAPPSVLDVPEDDLSVVSDANVDGEFMVDDLDAIIARNQEDVGMVPGVTDKSAMVAVTGWAVRGELQFQDGVPENGNADDCAWFGKTCDNEWHAQARTISYSDPQGVPIGTIFAEELLGLCGNTGLDGTGPTPNPGDHEWLPCLFPDFGGAPDSNGRTMRWRIINDASCGTQWKRDSFRRGVIQALAYYDQTLGFNFTEVTGGNWNLLFTCSNLGNARGMFLVRNNITFRAALAGTGEGDQSVISNEQCELSGLPGSARPGIVGRSYQQAPDMLYTYNQAQIVLSTTAWNTIEQVSNGSATLRDRAVANLMKHELGHWLGLHHTVYADPSLGIMRPSLGIQELVNFSMGFDSNMVDAIRAMSHLFGDGFGLEVPDYDVSCYKPSTLD